MTAPQFLEAARALDAEIQALDRLYVTAVTHDAHPKIVEHIAARRNDVTRQWAATWQTKPVQS